jgi:hypothetical protein
MRVTDVALYSMSSRNLFSHVSKGSLATLKPARVNCSEVRTGVVKIHQGVKPTMTESLKRNERIRKLTNYITY